ncbi:hypothetical protein ACVJ6Q_006257 [Bradyrhizobium elkanii]
MGRVAGVVVVADLLALQLERSVQTTGAGNAGIQHTGRQAAEAGGEDIEIGRVHVLLDAGFGDRLERSAGVALRGRCAGRVRLRHRVGRVVGRLPDRRCADIVQGLARDRGLLRQRKVRSRRSILVDDALRQQVRDGLPLALRLVDTEGVIKAAVLTDQNDDVLDRRRGLHAVIAVTMMAMILMLRTIALFVRLVIVMRTLVPITATARIVSGICGCCDEHR